MKLYNKTRYPNQLLESLLVEAGKSVGARTSNVIVIVNSSKPGYNHSYGTAYRADYAGEVSTDGGYFTLTVPYPFVPQWIKDSDIYPAWSEAHCFDGLNIAELIFSTAAHEWRHIKQYQDRLFNFHDRKERAKHHDNRVWEKDAIKASSKARNKPKNKTQETILSLAMWIEDNK